ncbi:MAG TPA: hypothetical protein VFY87_07770 [Geminicoccaceae bacterium]|nr:hypothetical protein [Geminicoccaceae bacterium]
MRTTAAPRPRSPAQVEASRRNGARSRGPVTPEGKRRSSRNALKHGLAALHHLVLADEDPGELEELTARLLAEIGPECELEARLVRRLAVAFWKGERAERVEVALLDGAPGIKPPTRGGTWEEAEAAETFDVRRFNAVRGHQAARGREISRCLKELRLLRREPLMAEQDEPEPRPRNEPCLARLWQKGEAPTPCTGWVRGVGDRNEPGIGGPSPLVSVIPPRIHVSPNG